MPHLFQSDLDAVASIDSVQKILQVICHTTGMGFSAVARVTTTHWVACAVRDEINFGLKPGSELVLETTICNEIRQSGKLVVIDHVSADPMFCGHHTPKQYGFQSYISVPINLPDGRFFGTLCAIDPRPAMLNTPAIINMFKLFADLIALHLDAQQRLHISETALLSERQTAKLRDQFIAVLGHDLRNPLSAIESSAQFLLMVPPTPAATTEFLGIIQRSARRMAALIDNVLDFARGKLGGGFVLHRTLDPELPKALQHVVTELQTANPARVLHADIQIPTPISADSARIAQLLSNLLANALTHGDPAGPIQVRALTVGDSFELFVTNHGQPIPEQILPHLFQPFTRNAAHRAKQGLGLGLYIVQEIATAHGGRMSVTSTPAQTCFTFHMPLFA